ncbi:MULTISPECIES: hypothetical protein [Mycobacteriaceae]|jgi:hypothetical protein|uniref:CHAT domain-containing protein n=2 Tax=Mycolicibacterium TaxID=1866885 RepID=A0ABT6GWW3_MYCGU|nr:MULTISPECIES: hypothetical protein [Mycobacteriaceae]MDG5486040.1 hypothetical protein [Mycolicibacterium gadium]MDX1882556.1 hypothetical protein [Mycolicibacterium sp. 120270]SEH54646.1 hypothetical protein SAMN04489835_1266 [Mycolicibacterium rutilum]
MTTKFKVNEQVFVPSRLLPNPAAQNFALRRAKVLEQKARSVRINLQDEHGNDIEVASRLVHRKNLGIGVIRIGDFKTELNALDPLAKSMMHYLRLLLEPDAVVLREVRTSTEICAVWAELAPRTSHIVLIGHGNADSLNFLDLDAPVGGDRFGTMLAGAAPKSPPKVVISLTCLTGRAAFASPFSASSVCTDYIAPFQLVHSAAASLFGQSFFANHLLSGLGVAAAFRRAHAAVGTGVTFRHWRTGGFTTLKR